MLSALQQLRLDGVFDFAMGKATVSLNGKASSATF